MEQEVMINQIMDFVEQHRESHASRNVFHRILGVYPERVDRSLLSELQRELQQAPPDEVEACYYIVS